MGRTRGPPGLLESALVSPVPIEERLAQTLGAGLMEPLQAALALQHFQVPPEGDTGLVTSRHSLLNCPTLLTTYSHPLQHSPHYSFSFIPWDSPTTTLCHSFVNPAPSLLTPQDHHSNSSSAAGCSDVQHPSPAPSVHMAETASYPAWLGHRGPSSVHPPSAEIKPAGRLLQRGGERKAWERLWVGGSHRKVPLPWWRWQRCTGGRPRMCPLPLLGLGPLERGSPGDKLKNDIIDGRAFIALQTCVC